MSATENKDLVSLIIPVYNVEKYVSQCLESAINQTYKNLEIIVVDDCSTDNSKEICLEYANKDSRIKFIQNSTNKGPSYTRNIALDESDGEWIAFLDSDDWIDKDAIERLLSFSIKNDVDIAMFPAKIVVDEKTTETAYRYYDKTRLLEKDEVIKKVLTDEIGGQQCVKFYKRKCWADLRFPIGRLYEDLAISYMPFIKACKIGYYDEPFYNYRMNPNSISHSKKRPEKQYHIFLAFYERLEYVKKMMPVLEEQLFEKTVIYALNVIDSYIRSQNKDEYRYYEYARKYLEDNKMRISRLSFSRYKLMAEAFLTNDALYIPLLKVKNFIGRLR